MSDFSKKHPYALAFSAIPLGALLAYVPHAVAVRCVGSNLDIATPRDSFELSRLDPNSLVYRLRCCHLNGLESLPLFFGAVLAAHAAKVEPSTVDRAALVWLVSRVLYTVAYAFCSRKNAVAGSARALFWTTSIGACFFLGYRAVKALL